MKTIWFMITMWIATYRIVQLIIDICVTCCLSYSCNMPVHSIQSHSYNVSCVYWHVFVESVYYASQ